MEGEVYGIFMPHINPQDFLRKWYCEGRENEHSFTMHLLSIPAHWVKLNMVIHTL